MKIWQVVHGFPPETSGGTERTVAALAHAMQRAGHDVTVVAGSLEPRSPEHVGRERVDGLEVLRLHREDLHYESWWKCHCPGVSVAFGRLLDELRPDVVHVHHWLRLSSDLVRQARQRGATTAASLHDYFSVLASPVRRIGQDLPEPPPVTPPVGEIERREAFEFHRRDFRDELAAAQLRYVPSSAHGQGVGDLGLPMFGDTLAPSPPPLLTRPPRRVTGEPRQRRLCTWGSIYPDKGLDSVLHGLRAVGPEPGWSLDVYGEAHDPGYAEQLRELARGLAVRFLGAFEPVDLSRAEVDYALLPSLCHESYGLVLDEALCLGWPILCADVPAYRERLPRGSGLLYPAGDAEALARLLGDDAALAALESPAVPRLPSAEDIAGQLLVDYGKAAAGEVDSDVLVDEVSDAERAAWYFRRAERRNWSALQRPEPPPAPW